MIANSQTIKKLLRFLISVSGALIFGPILFFITLVLLNAIFYFSSSFENSIAYFMLMTVSFVLVFILFLRFSFLLSLKEKKIFFVIFLLFSFGLYLPTFLIHPNFEDFPVSQRSVIEEALKKEYGSTNPSGVKIRWFKSGSRGGYSAYFDEYGFFGLKDGYYRTEFTGKEGSSAESGLAKQALPYFFLTVGIFIFLMFKWLKALISKLHAGKHGRTKG